MPEIMCHCKTFPAATPYENKQWSDKAFAKRTGLHYRKQTKQIAIGSYAQGHGKRCIFRLSNHKKLIEQTSTKTGLAVVVRLNLKECHTGIKIDKQNVNKKRIVYHPVIPELNCRIYPKNWRGYLKYFAMGVFMIYNISKS